MHMWSGCIFSANPYQWQLYWKLPLLFSQTQNIELACLLLSKSYVWLNQSQHKTHKHLPCCWYKNRRSADRVVLCSPLPSRSFRRVCVPLLSPCNGILDHEWCGSILSALSSKDEMVKSEEERPKSDKIYTKIYKLHAYARTHKKHTLYI